MMPPIYDPCIFMLESQDGRCRMFLAYDPVSFQDLLVEHASELIAGGRVLELTLSTVYLNEKKRLTATQLTRLSGKLPEIWSAAKIHATTWLKQAEAIRTETMGPGYLTEAS